LQVGAALLLRVIAALLLLALRRPSGVEGCAFVAGYRCALVAGTAETERVPAAWRGGEGCAFCGAKRGALKETNRKNLTTLSTYSNRFILLKINYVQPLKSLNSFCVNVRHLELVKI
jgi:hypothetical protein